MSVIDDLCVRLRGVAMEMATEKRGPVTTREALLKLLETKRFEVEDFAWSWRLKEIDGDL